MAVYGEDDLARSVYGSVTQAEGSNAAIDLDVDQGLITEDEVSVGPMPSADALRYEHPTYVAEKFKWEKYLNLYEARDVYSFIHRHLREDDAMWKKRVERGYFFNYVQSVVDAFTAFLFHAPIDRSPGHLADEFERIYKDADLSGTQWNVFWQNACTFAQVEGHVGILVDMPEKPVDGFETEAERVASEHRPYVALLHAKQILDWELDNFGNFKWVKVEVLRPDDDRDWHRGVRDNVRNFVIWTRERFEEWKLIENNPILGADGEQVGTEDKVMLVRAGEHDLGVVPLVVLRMAKQAEHPWFGVSSVRDIADINIAIVNWSSLGDEEIFERCLNVLCMERGEGDAPVQLAHGNTLEFEPGGKEPFYLTPGATALELILLWIKEARDEIRRLAKVRPSGGLGDVRQASSGIAHAFQFLETNQALAAKALGLQQAETRVHDIIARWLEDTFDGGVSYPSEFGVEDVLMLFQSMDMARSSLTSETAIKEMEKKLTRKLFASDSTLLRQTIEDEIEEADAQPTLETIFGQVPPRGTTPPRAPQEGSGESAPSEEDGMATDAESGQATAA